ncbi:hypothetical protein [Glaciihabitans tibetensis]|nr:hypothetical protein [Glaciihabitans tibetensis]
MNHLDSVRWKKRDKDGRYGIIRRSRGYRLVPNDVYPGAKEEADRLATFLEEVAVPDGLHGRGVAELIHRSDEGSFDFSGQEGRDGEVDAGGSDIHLATQW